MKIELSKNGKKYAGIFFAEIDEADSDLIAFSWSVHIPRRSRTAYALRRNGNSTIKIHEIVAERTLGKRPPNYSVDHINRNGLDNRRANLRYSDQRSQALNSPLRSDNTSGHKGVSWGEKRKAWRAYVWVRGKQKLLGWFTILDDAIIARKIAEKEFY